MFLTIKNGIPKYTLVFILGLVFIIGIYLRFKGLTYQSLWLDELCSVTVSAPYQSFWEMYDATVNDVHPPLYQTLLWLWYHLMGFNEFSGRALSAIFSSLSIFAIYLLGKALFNKEVGLYAAIITMSNQFLVFYGQETRSYSLLFLLSILSYLYFVKILTTYSKTNFSLYLFFTIALLYTHYFGFFLVATQFFVFIYFLITDKEKRKHLLKLASVTSIILLISLIPLIGPLFNHGTKESFWIPKPSSFFALDYIQAYVRNSYLESIFMLSILFSLSILFRKDISKTRKAMIMLLVIWIFLGYLLPYIRSILAIPLLSIRNTIIVIPALILLISYGIYLLQNKNFKIIMITIIVLFSLNQIHYGNYYTKVTKQQWREVLVEVSKSRSNMPMFDLVYDAFAYKTYAKALNMDLDIADYTTLVKKITQGTMEECFFVLESHGEHISKVRELKDPNIKKVLDIRKVMARGVLYSYKTTPEICLESYNGTKKKIGFNTCTFSKPYKGNPLLMQWSGSIFTPAYALPQDNYNLVVNAKGTKAFDEYAKVQLEVFTLVNNKRVLIAERIFTTTPEYVNYILPFVVNSNDEISFIISFINNNGRLVPREDRDIYLKYVTIQTQNNNKY